MLILLLLTSVLSLTTAQGVCTCNRGERGDFIDEDLEPMWPVRPKWDCSNEKIDAATNIDFDKFYLFKGQYYWKMDGKNVVPGYPRLISQDWGGIPGYLDAALTWTDGRTLLFKGSRYWSFHNKTMDTDYPRQINEGFCGIPDHIDGALIWINDDKAYFFKGSEYWRFDGGESCIPVSKEYPKPTISMWPNAPDNIDDALQWGYSKTYFFKEGSSYSFDSARPYQAVSSPISLREEWGLKCEELMCRVPPSLD